MMRHILIVGAGSVGKRHARNLSAEGCLLSVMDPRDDRRTELATEVSVRGAYRSLEDALASERYDGVVIASPPSAHVLQTSACLARGLPVYLEKPAGLSRDEAEVLAKPLADLGVPLLLGYTWRWWPPIEDVKKKLAAGAIGSLRHVRFLLSAHLADWHPWESYQDFFMASRLLGGGALLDESHWIDLMLYFFGMPEEVFAKVEKISDLKIDADDNVDLFFSYDGFRVSMHLDLFGRPHKKQIVFVGEGGTMRWSENPNKISIAREAVASVTDDICYDCQRNDMFAHAIREFLELIAGRAKVARCTMQDGLNVLKVLDAARQSSAQGRVVTLSGEV